MRRLKKYITDPKQSFSNKARKIKQRSNLKFQFLKNYFSDDYVSGGIDISWEGKPKRYDLINAAIRKFGYRTYLEIGCFKNTTFNRIECEKKVGVDPDIGGNVRMTSDEFFAMNKEKFDCIFIDGLHTYEQVLKDIKNSIECLNDGGVIFLDDCLPIRYAYQTVPPCHLVWNGDVWKSVVEIRTWENIETAVCLIDHGIGIIKTRPNASKLNIDTSDFRSLKYTDLLKNYKGWLNIIEFDNALEFCKGK